MAWFKREKKPIEKPTPVEECRVHTEGMWTKCNSCRAIIWKRDLETNWEVCPKCDHHFRLGSRRRLEMLLDEEPWTELDAELASSDPLHFTDTRPYAQRLKEAKAKGAAVPVEFVPGTATHDWATKVAEDWRAATGKFILRARANPPMKSQTEPKLSTGEP